MAVARDVAAQKLQREKAYGYDRHDCLTFRDGCGLL
jgi:hypothetical protein